jgi:hypothetical protein
MKTPAEHLHTMKNDEQPSLEPLAGTAPTTEERLAEDVLVVLSEATAGLTEDEILAVITMRRERAIFVALEELILQGGVGATREGPLDRVATSGDFAFWALTDDEVAARRRRSEDGAPLAGADRLENPPSDSL